MGYPGTDPTRLLHRVLMAPAALERVPRWIILLILGAMAGSLAWMWPPVWHPAIIAAGWFTFVLLDWIMLDQLPRQRRSFGPVHPALLALAGFRWALAGLLALTRQPWSIPLTMALVSCLAWYATWIEPFSIRVSHREVRFSQWPAGTPPLRLLQLGDLHLERAGLREERLQRLVDELAPDVICFSGDLLNLSYNADARSIDDARRVVGRWSAPRGVYAVTGSPLVDLPQTARAILNDLANTQWLVDETVTLDLGGHALSLIGLSCTHDPSRDAARLKAALTTTPHDAPTVLIYHTPDLAPEAAAMGIDLQLSGHTHGGQIRLPAYGALVTSSIYRKRFEAGEYHLPHDDHEGVMTLYVSRGIGTEGGIAPRARFLCPPEIVLWTLRGGDERDSVS
jgi:predicted MPP superfamily phosphohydrolase